MLKNLSLTLKLSLLHAVALLGLLLFVVYTSVQLAANDARLDTLENNSLHTLEKADAVNFQFSRLPGMLNSAVAAGEQATLDEARKVLADIADLQQAGMQCRYFLHEVQPQPGALATTRGPRQGIETLSEP